MVTVKRFLKRAVTAALFCFIPSCAHQQQHNWHKRATRTRCPKYNSSLLSYTPECASNGIGFESLRTNTATWYYLNLYSFPICTKEITIKASCCADEVKGFVMQGGQRICLPTSFGKAIEESLLSNKAVEIEVGNYRHKVFPDST